jgi:outer membrane protein OmpA-like peptidoglycan-associated protein
MLCTLCVLVLLAATAHAADRSGYDRLVADMDAARLARADVFAPKTWEKVEDSFAKARRDVAENKKQADLDKHVAEAAAYTANAVKAAEVGKLSLQEYLAPRDKAIAAGAPKLVPELYAEAEEVFLKATRKVEDGNVKDALKEGAKARPLFDTAELEAIRAAILGKADRLIAKAEADDAAKYAPSTLDKARSARSKANTILTADRYNRDEAVDQAARAAYEARHASNIGLSVRSLERNDQAWEKLMLGYEIQMNRVGQAFGIEHLPFDDGPQAATDDLVERIVALQTDNHELTAQLDGVSSSLRISLGRFGGEPAAAPLELAEQVDQGIMAVQLEQQAMARKLATGQADLAALEEQRQVAEAELAARREKEAKFRRAKTLLNPSEGEVLFNAANDIVLRLHGLSFSSGRSEIEDQHVALLAKVQEVVKMYPDAHFTIEGHTDTLGDPGSNVTLSEKRSYAVMQYLRQSMLLPMDQVKAIGYGADHPVASNKTPDGRAKNRRIDIVIMQ